MKKEIKWGSISIKGLEDENYNKFPLNYLAKIENGQNSGQLSIETGLLKVNSKKGGDKCKEEQKGIFTLSKEQLSNQGKKGYSNGLSKLSKEEIFNITSIAGKTNREKNAKLKSEDVLYVRQVFIPRHSEFGIVALSKKYGVTESTMRNAIKGKSFKDI